MQQRLKVLRELVRDSSYTVDPDLVADAIIERARARQLLPGTRFRNEVRPADVVNAMRENRRRAAAVRSFRPSRGARSFHLTAPRRPRDAHHRAPLVPAA
jgi:hypothetical protein